MCSNPKRHFYYDHAHPTTTVHETAASVLGSMLKQE
jgi:phospholipase/lecithinase/hemolysin